MTFRFLVVLWALAIHAQAPDLIVHHAKVVTVDTQFRIAQAIAIRGDRIVAVGTRIRRSAEATGIEYPELSMPAERVFSQGLIDSHVHAADASMYEFDHEIPTMETIPDVLRYIRSRTAVVPKGEWISLSQVFITRLREQRYPTRAELDSAAPEHAVIFATGPDASLNTLALKKAGITKTTQPPAGQAGKVELDPKTGEPTGIIRSASHFLKVPQTGRLPTGGGTTGTPENDARGLQLGGTHEHRRAGCFRRGPGIVPNTPAEK